jgi:hypothetical protein
MSKAPNPSCCSSARASDRCAKCRSMQVNTDPDDDDEDDDENEDDFDFPTHNQKGASSMIVTNAAGDKIPTTAWDYGIDFSGAVPRLSMQDLASQRLVDNVQIENAKAERAKSEGSNADSFGDASELMRAGRGGKEPAEEEKEYWLPERIFAGDGAAIALQKYQDELLAKVNRKRMQLDGDEEEEKEMFRDYLELPSMEKFVEADRKTKTAAIGRED